MTPRTTARVPLRRGLKRKRNPFVISNAALANPSTIPIARPATAPRMAPTIHNQDFFSFPSEPSLPSFSFPPLPFSRLSSSASRRACFCRSKKSPKMPTNLSTPFLTFVVLSCSSIEDARTSSITSKKPTSFAIFLVP